MVKLRRLEQKDAPVIAQLLNNRKVWDQLRDYVPFPYQLTDASNFIDKCGNEEPALTFGIEDGLDVCGVIGLVPQSDVYQHSAEIGYWIGESFWGKGIATEALRLLIKYAFHQLHFRRLYAGVFEQNKASCRVLEKAGFSREGQLRHAVLKNGRLQDEIRYGLTV